jgi:aminoglycoside phosphotransferase family enzyme
LTTRLRNHVLNTSQKLVESLQRPGVLAETAERIELLQTHMSWILLADQHAYKIKKPVNLGFADFTGLEKRRYFCNEELRVNRRLAPDLYLAVLPITGTCQSPVVGGDGEPIEYAVTMKQFPQRELLPHVLERGELGPQHFESLARDVAEFHRVVEVDSDRGRFGEPENVWRPMQANLDHFEQSLDDAALRSELRQVKRWSENEFADKRDDFAARKRDGFIRECHGDMHLGNMFRDGNSITLFDGIEFNEAFRWIDVLNEIAFLVMDLKYRRRADLAHRFLNAYLEQTGDYRGLVVLPFYQVYRAMVRAKVKDIRSRQPQLAPQARNALRDQVRDYLAWQGNARDRNASSTADYARSRRNWKNQGHRSLGGSGGGFVSDRTSSGNGNSDTSTWIGQIRQSAGDLFPGGHGSNVPAAGGLGLHGHPGGILGHCRRHVSSAESSGLAPPDGPEAGCPFRILDFHARPETIRRGSSSASVEMPMLRKPI